MLTAISSETGWSAMMYVRTPLRQERLASTRDMRLRSAGMTLRMSALVYLGGDCCWLFVALLARVCCAVACACLLLHKSNGQVACACTSRRHMQH